MLASWLLFSTALADTPGTWTVVMPLGIPQFAHGKPGRGALFGGIQAAGIGASTVATIKMIELAQIGDANAVDEEIQWRLVSVGSVALTGAAWFASVIDGARLHDVARAEAQARADSVRHWDTRPQSLVVTRETTWRGPAESPDPL